MLERLRAFSRAIRRIIGLPGDRVRIEKQIVYINDQPLMIAPKMAMDSAVNTETSQIMQTEKIGSVRYQVQWNPQDDGYMAEITVPQGEVFVLGDNRSETKDSRAFGTLPLYDVVGKARQIWFSWDKGIRWERLGTVLHRQ